MNLLRVVVADDSATVRAALARLLGTAGCDVVGQAADSPTLLEAAEHSRPDVALVDLWLADGSAVGAVRLLATRNPPVHSVLMSAAPAAELRLAATLSGCPAYLPKSTVSARSLRQTLELAATTRRPAAAPAPRGEPSRGADVLLDLLLEGRSDEEIGRRLRVDVEEVRRRVAVTLDELGLGSQRRTEPSPRSDGATTG